MSNCPRYCEKCGAQADPAHNFCEFCGAPLHTRRAAGEEGIQTAPAGSAEPRAGGVPACPRCGHSDGVTSVYSIYQMDQVSLDNYAAWLQYGRKDEGSGRAGGDDSAGQNKPASLAEKLAPPKEPKYAKNEMIFWAVLPLFPFLNAVMLWFAPMGKKMKTALLLAGVLLVTAWILQARAEKYLLSLDVAYYIAVDERLVHIGPFTVLDAPYLAGILLLVIYYTGLWAENARRKAYFRSAAVPAYREALARWHRLYYCSRCDGVFAAGSFPGKPDFVPADKMGELLYEKIPDGV